MATIGSEPTDITPSVPVFKIRDVGMNASLRWLNKGIADFKAAPKLSFSYGLVYVVIGAILMWLTWHNPLFIASLVTGFMLIGPVVAVGFYSISKDLEKGIKPDKSHIIAAVKYNAISLASLTLVLGFILASWAIIAPVVIALFFNNIIVNDNFIDTLLSNPQMFPFLFVYCAIGLGIAIIAFSISVISVPLITNRRTDFVTAMVTSVKAVIKNPLAMMSWGFMIATLVFVGFMLAFVGLSIILPIIGHASWHAYRELVIEE